MRAWIATSLISLAACASEPVLGGPCASVFDCPKDAACVEGVCRNPDDVKIDAMVADLKAAGAIDDEEAAPLRIRLRRIALELDACKTDECRAALAAEKASIEPKLAEAEARAAAIQRKAYESMQWSTKAP